jgi:arginine utilization protein RocB
MTKEQEKECVANMSRLDEIVRLAEEASPELRRRGARSAQRLAERQNRAFAHILANPDSLSYRDYVETPSRYGV